MAPREPAKETVGQQKSRVAILAAATEEFSAHGLDGTRIERVAKRAGCNKALIYRYFGDKDGLFRATLQRQFEQRSAVLDRQPAALGDAFVHWFQATLDDPDFMRLIQREALNFDGTAPVAGDYRRTYYQRQIGMLKDGQAAGVVDGRFDARMLFLALLSVVVYPSAFPQITQLATGLDVASPAFRDGWAVFLQTLATQLEPKVGQHGVATPDEQSVPPGKLAAVVTSLEMREAPPGLKRVAEKGNLAIRRVETPDLEWYRRLFRAVGAPWLWFSRLTMTDAALRAVIYDTAVDVFVLTDNGSEIGLLELDRRVAKDIELSFLGLVPESLGTGAGKFLLDFAIAEAWSHSPARFWVHTCTLDHPRALPFYMAAGFKPYACAVEIADDPRKTGVLPADAAPHVPVI